jgi:hypothetical protein
VFVDDYDRGVERDFSYQVFGSKEPAETLRRINRDGVEASEQAHFIFTENDCIVAWDSCALTTSVVHSAGANSGVGESWVVLLSVNDGYFDFFLNWLKFYEKLDLNLNIVVIAEDERVRSRLLRLLAQKSNDKPLFKLDWGNLKGKKKKALEYDTEQYKELVSLRPTYILQKLREGYNVIYSDVDTVWRSSPLPFLPGGRYASGKLAKVDLAILVDDDEHIGLSPYYCTGFMAVRPNKRTIRFMSDWEARLLQEPQLNQPVFNKVLHDRKTNVVHQPLPKDKFPSGFQYFNKYTARQIESAVVVHNNYIEGHDAKKERFIEFHLWLLDEPDQMPSVTLEQ